MRQAVGQALGCTVPNSGAAVLRNAANAGLLALQILAISDPALREQLHRYRQGLADMVTAKDARLQELGSSNYLAQ